MTEKTLGAKVQKICEFCGAELKQIPFELGGVTRYIPIYEPCSCDRAKEKRAKEEEAKRLALEEQKRIEIERKNQEKIKALFGNSGMSKRALSCKFEGYQITLNNQDAVRLCNDYVSRFKEIKSEKKNGLFLAGPCGVGKSHLAYAVANSLIERKNSVVCMTMIDLLLKLKSSYSGDESSEEKILKIYEDCSLLIIDDLGKEKPTEWALQMIYAIIDRRYNAFKPIIVTTNYTAKELVQKFSINGDNSTGSAIVDRLFEMCQYVPIDGESYRKREV